MESIFNSAYTAGPVPPDNNSSKLQTDPNYPASLPDPDMMTDPFSKLPQVVADVAQTIEPTSTVKGRFIPFEAVEKYKGTSTYNPYMSPYGDAAKIAADNWSMWDAVSTGLSGLTDNALLAGKEYAYGWVRAGRALMNFDSDYLRPSAYETEVMNVEQKLISRENPIYFDPGKEDDIFTRQTAAEFMQNIGFTLGTLGGFMTETALMGGAGKIASKLPTLFKAGALSKSKNIPGGVSAASKIDYKKLDDYIKDMYGSGVFTGKSVMDNALNVASRLPIVGAIADAGKVMRAANAMQGAGTIGLTTTEIARLGAGGLKRAFSEWNFAASEAAIEAGGTYGEVYDTLYDKYLENNFGKAPEGAELEKIRNMAMNASTSGYNTNLAVLAVMNRIQFGNVFRNFGRDSKFLNLLRSDAQRVIAVQGADKGGKQILRNYARGYWGILGHKSDITNQFSKQVFYRELGRDMIRGLGRVELLEGLQENIQEGTNEYLKKYYSDLYDDNVATWSSSFKEAFDSQTTKRGFKTFLQGALTGLAIRPIVGAAEATSDYLRKAAQKSDPGHVDALQNTLNRINDSLSDPAKLLSENHRSLKEQIIYNEGMTEGAANNNKYQYLNNRESALIRLALDTKSVGTFDAVLSYLNGFGQSVDPAEFKEATGIDIEGEGLGSPSEYVSNVVGKLKRYGDLYDGYNQRFNDYFTYEPQTNDPYSKQRWSFSQAALREAIRIAAFNQAKAENALERSASIAQDVAKVRGIGQSAATNFNNVTDHSLAAQQISIIDNEIKTLQQSGPPTAESQRLIRLKEQEKQALTEWNEEAYSEQVVAKENEQETIYVPLERMKMDQEKRKRLADVLTRYYQAKNEQLGVKTPIVSTDVESVLDSINDYQKLDKDTKEYFEAVNILSNPDNALRAIEAYEGSKVAAYARLLHENYEILAQESEIFANYLSENPQEMENLLRIATSPFTGYDMIASVMKSGQTINDLIEKDKKAKVAEFEFATRPGAPINVKALQNLNPNAVSDFIARHYDIDIDPTTNEIKGIQRFYMDKSGQKIVTDIIPLEKIVEFYKNLSGDEITPDNITGYMMGQFARYYEQSLFYRDFPKAEKGDEDRIWQKELILQETKKLYNLLGQRVLYLGKPGFLDEDGQNYFIEFDETGEIMILAPTGGAALARFQWTLNDDNEYVLTEVDSPDFLSTDNYPYLYVVGDNMTEQEKSLTGESLEAIAVRVAGEAYKVDDYVRDETGESITIGGNNYRVVRNEEQEVVSMTHDFAEGRVVFTAERATLDPQSIDNKYIAIANIMYIRSMDVVAGDISEDKLDAALDQVDDMNPTVDQVISPVSTTQVKRRVRKRKTEIPVDGASSVELQAERIMNDFTEDLIVPIQKMLASSGEKVNSINRDVRRKLYDWALKTKDRLNKLDPDNETVIDYISSLNDVIITPIGKKDGITNPEKQSKKATRKATKARKQTSKTKSKPGEPSAPTAYEKGSIQGASDFVTSAYEKKNEELAVKIDELLPQEVNLFNAAEIQEASKVSSFNKKAYRSNTKKDVNEDPFDNPPFTC